MQVLIPFRRKGDLSEEKGLTIQIKEPKGLNSNKRGSPPFLRGKKRFPYKGKGTAQGKKNGN